MNPEQKFSMGTALSVGIQCLEALEDLHSIGYLHRDVKPANYTVGRKELNELRKVERLISIVHSIILLNLGLRSRLWHGPSVCAPRRNNSKAA